VTILTPICAHVSNENIQLAPIATPEITKYKKRDLFSQNSIFCLGSANIQMRKMLPIKVRKKMILLLFN